MSKQARPHSPAGTRLRGPDGDGNYEVIIPSASAPGTEHTLDVTYTGAALGCSCPGYRRYLDYLASLRTATPLPARRPCWHVEGAADLLAHHLDPPPADPGGAALNRAQDALGDEIGDWRDESPPYPYPLPTLDEAVAPAGDRWIQSRTSAGVRLTCTSCGAVRGWATEVGAIDWLATDGRCSCGGTVPPPPAPGAGRRALSEHLNLLYGDS